MAIPVFAAAGGGVTITAGSAGVSGPAGVAGDFLILQVLQVTTTASAVSITPPASVSNLAGTGSAMTLVTIDGGNPATVSSIGLQWMWFGRYNTSATPSITVATTGSDLYCRAYKFTGVNAGTTQNDVCENVLAGTILNSGSGGATSTTIEDTAVQTTAADRLAVNFVAVTDDNPLGSFTGMSGGTWAEGIAEYASATGNPDGAIQLQIADMASAGTINGGTFVMGASDGWGVIGTALIPAAGGGTTYTKAGFGKENA